MVAARISDTLRRAIDLWKKSIAKELGEDFSKISDSYFLKEAILQMLKNKSTQRAVKKQIEKALLIEEGKRMQAEDRHFDWSVTHHNSNVAKLEKKSRELPPSLANLYKRRLERMSDLKQRTINAFSEDTDSEQKEESFMDYVHKHPRMIKLKHGRRS